MTMNKIEIAIIKWLEKPIVVLHAWLSRLLEVNAKERNEKAVAKILKELEEQLKSKRAAQNTSEYKKGYQRFLWLKSLTPKKECKHLKGAEGSPWGIDKYGGPRRSSLIDYNVATHTFINGTTRIWCLNGCGFESWEGDEKWQQALKMIQQTSNTRSSSGCEVLKIRKA